MGVPRLEEGGDAALISPRTRGTYDGVQRVDAPFFANGNGKAQDEKSPLKAGALPANRRRFILGGIVVAFLVALFTVGVVVFRRIQWERDHPDEHVPFELAVHPAQPAKQLWGNMQRPFPTGAFFLNAGVEQGDGPVVAYPYAMSFALEGVHVSYSASRRYLSQKAVADIFASDLKVTTHERPTSKSIAAYDSFSVTERYTTADGGGFDVVVVKGSPYVTIEYRHCAPILTPLTMFSNINSTQPSPQKSELSGRHFKMETTTGQTWLLFTSSNVTFAFSNVQMWATAPFTGTMRLALLPNEVDETILKQHSVAYPTGGSVSYAVNGDSVDMTYSWSQKGSGELLMLALPHHADVLLKPKLANMQGSYRCIKGPMTPVRGSTWVLRDNLTTIEWTSRQPIDPERVEEIREGIFLDVQGVPPIAPDPYGFGKQVGRQARLALIADEVGDEYNRDTALALVQNALALWLEGKNGDALVYDTTWGGVVTTLGLEDDHADYGNGYYADHHFHWGYYVYAAAVVIKFDPSFYEEYKEQLDFLIGDVATDFAAQSRHFPVARHKDFYDWHSWTSPIFSQGNGKSQESVSEALNCYYGVYLFGLATANQRLADWGRLLTQMEIRAAQTYWQMPPGNKIYDPAFSMNRMAGVIGALDVVANTWFGSNLEFVHGINSMPFTPITEELLRPEYVGEEYPVLGSIFTREEKPQDQWAAFAYLDQAILEPEEAWDSIKAIRTFDAGNSLTNSLWWIATRPVSGVTMSDPFAGQGSGAPDCAANAACAVLGLQGLCCPTAEGMRLGCCPDESAPAAPAKAVEQGETPTKEAKNAAEGADPLFKDKKTSSTATTSSSSSSSGSSSATSSIVAQPVGPEPLIAEEISGSASAELAAVPTEP